MGNSYASLREGDVENNVIQFSSLNFQTLLGEGSTGSKVYRAELTTMSGIHVVAAKKLRTLPFQKDDLNRVCRIRNKYIVSYHGAVIDSNQPTIVMDLGINGSLYGYLRDHRPKGRLPSKQAGAWMSQVAGAVKFIQNNEYHLEAEVKSSNFMIFAENQLKLGDFHVPRSVSAHIPPVQKIKWMAPEVYKEKQRGPKSDVFSCGIVFWEILTCEPPFEGMSKGDIYLKVAGTQQLRPDIPFDCNDSLRQLMMDCWQQDPDSRPDISTVKRTIKQIIAKGDKISIILEPLCDVPTNPTPTAMCCYTPNKNPFLVAVCTRSGDKKAAIEVYDTSAESGYVYRLESPDWVIPPIGVAATRGMILAVCKRKPYVYQFRKHNSATQENQKFAIADYPMCIAVNRRCAVVGVEEDDDTFPGSLVVLSLPTMQREKKVDLRFVPRGLDMNDIASNFILVMGERQLSVRNITEDAGRDLCTAAAPNETVVYAAVFPLRRLSRQDRIRVQLGRNLTATEPPEVYVAAVHSGSGSDGSTVNDAEDQNETGQTAAASIGKGKRKLWGKGIGLGKGKGKGKKKQNGKGKPGSKKFSGADSIRRTSQVYQYRWDATKNTYVVNGAVLSGLGVIGRNGLRFTRKNVCVVSEPNVQKLKMFV